MIKAWSKILLTALAITVVSSLIGLGVNTLRAEGIPLVQKQGGPTLTGIEKIDLATAKLLYDTGSALFIDARSEDEFEAGHIKNAINVPYESFEELFIDKLDPLDRAKVIVTYCSGEGCHSSDNLALMLKEEGFTALKVFFGGWPEWKGASHPTTEPASDKPVLYKLD